MCELYETQLHGGGGGRHFLHAHSHSADNWQQSTVEDLMDKFPDAFQTVTDRNLFGPNVPHGLLTNTGCVAQALSSLNQSCTVRQTTMSAKCPNNYNQTWVDPLQHRQPLPKLDILAVGTHEEPPGVGEAEDDVKGGPLDTRDVKAARQKKLQYLWDTEVYDHSPKRNRGHERDAPQLALRGSIPTKVALSSGVY